MIEPEGGSRPQQPSQPGTPPPPPPPPPMAPLPPMGAPPPMAPPPPPAPQGYAPPAPTYAPPPATYAAPAAPATPGISISLSQPEALVAGGAALIVLTDLIFNIFGPYFVRDVIWVAAAVSLVLVLAHSRLPFIGARRELIIALAALVAVLAGARSLLQDLVSLTRLGGRTIDLAFILGMVGLYVGIALLAWGAWTLWQRRPLA